MHAAVFHISQPSNSVCRMGGGRVGVRRTSGGEDESEKKNTSGHNEWAEMNKCRWKFSQEKGSQPVFFFFHTTFLLSLLSHSHTHTQLQSYVIVCGAQLLPHSHSRRKKRGRHGVKQRNEEKKEEMHHREVSERQRQKEAADYVTSYQKYILVCKTTGSGWVS